MAHPLKPFKRLFLALVLTLAALNLDPASVAHAAIITVNTTEDEFNSDGDCSLREAIQAANTDSGVDACTVGNGPDTIELAAGATYTLSTVDNNTDGPNGLSSITSEIAINGNGATIERSSADGTLDFRIFHVDAGGNLTLNNLTITNGQTPNDINGGGMYNAGTLTLNNSTVSDNTSGAGGPGNPGGTGGDGGGILNGDTGMVYSKNTLIAGNRVRTGGSGPDCSGTLTSQGYNLVGDGTGCPSNGTGDQTTSDPRLPPWPTTAAPPRHMPCSLTARPLTPENPRAARMPTATASPPTSAVTTGMICAVTSGPSSYSSAIATRSPNRA